MVNGRSTLLRMGGVLGAGLVLLGLACPCVTDRFAAGFGLASATKAAPPVQAVTSRPPPSLPPPPPLDPEPRPIAEVLRSGMLIVISKRSQNMFVFKDGVLWESSAVSTGRRGHVTPSGVFAILQKRVHHRSNKYSNAPMPFMQRLTWDGIAIHAGRLPGYPASHGCIRLPHGFAKALYSKTNFTSTTVVITNMAIKTEGSARTLALNTPMPRPRALAAVPDVLDRAFARATLLPPASPEAATAQILPAPQPSATSPQGGQTIQLAAADTEESAEAEWSRLVSLHPELGRLEKSVVPAVVSSRQVYRLRVSAPQAHALCATLQTKGTACFNVQ